nr:zinc finger BED domain-containing protein RICESLEEPER 2-like [Ipomoea batatas]
MEANQDDATTINTAVDLEVESTGGTASKGKSKTSEVWTYFIDIGPNEKGKGRSQCKGSKKLDIGLAREVFVAAIVEHDCPFAFAEYPGFRKYHKLLNPDAPMISRNTLVSDINKLYLKEKNKLKQVLTSIPNRIYLTSDLWTACTTEGYICLTSHFVDEKWKLNSKILAFDKMPPPHTGFELAQKMYEILKDWGIEKKDVLDVSDEIVEPVEISKLDRYLEQPCYEMKFYQDLDVLDHWKGCVKGFPILSCMARDLLAIPITNVASESAFSIGALASESPEEKTGEGNDDHLGSLLLLTVRR